MCGSKLTAEKEKLRAVINSLNSCIKIINNSSEMVTR